MAKVNAPAPAPAAAAKAAQAPAPAAQAQAPAAPAPAAQAPAQAPQAPLFVMGGWPAKAQGGGSVRAYCYAVAKGLLVAHPQGFTKAQFASALAASAQGSTCKQPSTGWGTAQAPNGAAMAHANWFAHAKQGWLAPAPAAAK